MKKINITRARKEFNKGVTVYLLPNKVGFNSCWITASQININETEEKDFDKLVNAYSYYNCNAELGNRVAFYINE